MDKEVRQGGQARGPGQEVRKERSDPALTVEGLST